MTNETQINNEIINDDEQAYAQLLRQVNIVIDQRTVLNMSKKVQKIDPLADFAFERYVREIEDAEANGKISVSVALRSLQDFLKQEQIHKSENINSSDFIESEVEQITQSMEATHSSPLKQDTIIKVIRSVEQNNCSFLSKRIANEIIRLSLSTKANNNLLVNLGLVEASDNKQIAFNQLKQILDKRSEDKTNSAEFKAELIEWKSKKEACIKTQRNKIHSFFSPAHVATSELLMKEIFVNFNVDTKPATIPNF